jgi:hypothetical protein
MARTAGRIDAVTLMRSIRDRLSAEFAGLSFEEERRRIGEHLQGRTPSKARVERTRRKTARRARAS